MSDDGNQDITVDAMQKMIQQVMQANQNMQGARGRRGGNIKIKSVLVPIKVTDRRETCRMYIEFEAEVNNQNDLLDVLFQIEDAGFEVNWWQQKQDYNRGRR